MGEKEKEIPVIDIRDEEEDWQRFLHRRRARRMGKDQNFTLEVKAEFATLGELKKFVEEMNAEIQIGRTSNYPAWQIYQKEESEDEVEQED